MKTNSENFLVTNNINISVLNEQNFGDMNYALIKINLFGKGTYCICVIGNGYALECLGEDEEFSKNIFDTVIKGKPDAEHIWDIVTDARHAQIYC